jgi:hypothetical protein
MKLAVFSAVAGLLFVPLPLAAQPHDAALSAPALSAVARLRALYPEVQFYVSGTRVTRVYGTPLNTAATPEAAAEEFVHAHAGVFGAEVADLDTGNHFNAQRTQPVRYEPDRGTYRFTLVYYAQYRGGVPVYNADLRLLVLNQAPYPVVWAGSSLRELGDFSLPVGPSASDPSEQSHAAALKLVPGLALFTPGHYVIWAGVDDDVIRPALGYLFYAQRGTPAAADYARWLFIVEPTSGKILYSEDQIVRTDVTGTVRGMATTGPAADICGPEVATAMPYAKVSIGVTTAYADVNGSFTIPNNGQSAVLVESPMSGRYFVVENLQGAEESLTRTVTPPGPADFVHNAANNDEAVRAQVNSYIHANIVRDFCLTYHPDYPTVSGETDFPVRVMSTDASICPGNAWYDGSAINFCAAGGIFANFAFSNVVHHEYGHHMVECGGSGQGAYGEGMGDAIGALIADDPVHGWGERGACNAGARTADNTCQYQVSGCSSCGSEIHACGQLLSGCIWSTRTALLSAGHTDALAIISGLTIDSILLHSGTLITPQITIDFLTVDDDDGHLWNGTPHGSEICTGFGEHNMSSTVCGACCYSDGSCAMDLVSACGATGGTFWWPGRSCAPNPCSQPGACCLPGGGCHMSTVIAPGDCPSGYTYLGDDTTCSPADPCPIACCFADGHCEEIAIAQCIARAGTYVFASCAGAACSQPGACCFSDGHCEDLMQGVCLSLGGVFHPSACSAYQCPQPETGACCYGDGTCSVIADGACTGWWLGTGTTCGPNACPVTGACCSGDGTCSLTPQSACTHWWQGAWTTCWPNACLQPGACCRADGTCAVVAPPCNGIFQGPGTSCGSSSCPQPNIACCFSNLTCQEMPAADCTAQGGTPHAYPSSCTPYPCGDIACCFNSGMCIVMSAGSCEYDGGIAQPPGTPCTPNPCPQPPLGACCFADQHCSQEIQAYCQAVGIAWLQGQSCDPNLCGPPGACCFADGHCELRPAVGCGGDAWLGPGTSCSTNPCGPTGACCVVGNCNAWTEHYCSLYGSWGHWLGPGVPCESNTCRSACCLVSGLCTIVLDESQCAPQGGVFLGWGTSCTVNPCVPEPGAIVIWGCTAGPECDVPAPNAGFIAADGGRDYNLGLKADGTIVAWGSCTWGDCNAPVPNAGFAGLSAGGLHNLGLRANGSVVAWGVDWSGQCDVPSPNADFVAVAAGYGHSLGLKANRSVVAWGDNAQGQCNVPPPNTNFVAVAAGWYHSLGLRTDGSIAPWGYNYWGQCNVPAPNSNFVAVAAGVYHSLGLKADGSIVAWGDNGHGECNVPAPNTDFVAVAAGGYNSDGFSLGLKANGSIVTWGSGDPNVPAPNTHFTRVAAGWYYRLGVIDLGPRACCLPNGQCQQLTQAACQAQGGIWHSRTTCASFQCSPAHCPGDMNCDGRVTFADIDLFVEALSGESAWTHWPCPWLSADCNHDGHVNFADIDPFVALIGKNCATGACCYADYTCAITAQAGCTGNWLGTDTTCDQCPQPPTGACCVVGACTLTTQAICSGTWHGAGTICTPNPCLCAGDTDCDGRVTFADIDLFVAALSGESAWTHAPCPWLNADCNNSGTVTFADIDPFVATIGRTCP